MPRFAANLSMMFTERPFLERFGAAAAAGFDAVEFLFPYAFAAHEIRARLGDNGLVQALFNLPPGDFEAGERGIACLAGRRDAFRTSVAQALAYADALDCGLLHCMAGVRPRGRSDDELLDTYCENLAYAAGECRAAGRTLLIEPINGRDMPGYLMNSTALARRVIDRVGAANLRLQLDLYHCQISEGDLATRIRANADLTAHVQIAGVPHRHEPDRGEVNYRFLFDLLDETGFKGFVGCEYRPKARTEDGLSWFAPYRRRAVATA
ncbi:MAG TPA: 2-oxo-tetronate isomerase [Microvirga sp.]|jgi:hydroxypyruvate isomerase